MLAPGRLSEELLEAVKQEATITHRTYMDDQRNTDNAWMETTAFHYHCVPSLAARLDLPESGFKVQSSREGVPRANTFRWVGPDVWGDSDRFFGAHTALTVPIADGMGF